MKNVPKNIYIIDGGAVGLEAASFFNSLGAEVTVVDYMPNICGEMDKGMAQVLQKLFEKQKINFLMNTKLEEFRPDEILFRSDDRTFNTDLECVFIAIGRKPLIMDLTSIPDRQ